MKRAPSSFLLWAYQSAVGIIQPDSRLLPPQEQIKLFKRLLKEEWQHTLALVEQARATAAHRVETP